MIPGYLITKKTSWRFDIWVGFVPHSLARNSTFFPVPVEAQAHFICPEVEYLGHKLTPEGLKPNPRQVSAVKDFHIPRNVSAVRQFMGLASYYRRFVRGFATIAQPPLVRELSSSGHQSARPLSLS